MLQNRQETKIQASNVRCFCVLSAVLYVNQRSVVCSSHWPGDLFRINKNQANTEIWHFWRNFWWFSLYLTLAFHHVEELRGRLRSPSTVSSKLVPCALLPAVITATLLQTACLAGPSSQPSLALHLSRRARLTSKFLFKEIPKILKILLIFSLRKNKTEKNIHFGVLNWQRKISIFTWNRLVSSCCSSD